MENRTGDTAPEPTATQFWEARYADAGQVWSGRANETLVDIVADLPVGRALDLGCGEGADAIWLAQQGWQVTGIDISRTAIARAAAAAAEARIPQGRTRWLAADLASWTDGTPNHPYDLVTASFLHSPVELPRTDILRRAAALVASGGHLLILSHAAFPPWSAHHHDEHRFPAPAEEVASLGLPEKDWQVRLAETRDRQATGPDGQHAVMTDVVVLLRRAHRSGPPERAVEPVAGDPHGVDRG